jgi:hypothetical protein
MRKTIGAWVVFLIASSALTGCGLLYTNNYLPYEYRTATPADVHADKSDPQVTGESCNSSALFLVSWGNAGYASAARAALAQYPGGTLYDVQSDLKVSAYLFGLYTHTCTVLTGKVAKP